MKTIVLSTLAGASTNDLQLEIEGSEGPFVCILDDVTRVQESWSQPAVADNVALISAPVSTALGKRLGYEWVQSLLEGKTHRRQPKRMPLDLKAGPYYSIDIPNAGCLLLRISALRELGGLKRQLSPALALLDFAIRVKEAGLACVSDIRNTLHRAPGYAEACLSDEAAFSALRSDEDWCTLLRGRNRRIHHLKVDLLVTGRSQEAEAVLAAAGYPIERIYWATEEAVPSHLQIQRCEETAERVLKRALLERRGRAIAVIDLSTQPIIEDWLLGLIEESVERFDVAIATIGSDGRSRRVQAADAQATLLRSERIPVQIIPEGADNLGAFMAELCARFPGNGIGIRQTAHQIFRAKILAEPSFEMPCNPSKSLPAYVSIITISSGVGDVNELTSTRLRANTREPYDFTVIIRRTYQDIIKRLRTDSGINVLVDSSDSMGVEQLSLALSQAKGEYIALLRDDVVIPEGWLEPLEHAMKRISHAGIVAPRISNGSGTQAEENARFANTAEFHLTAKKRRKEFSRTATIVHSLTQPMFLIRRAVIDRVGGFDPSFAISEFGILDFCIRTQAAGYSIVIAEDAMLHRIHPDFLQNEDLLNGVKQNYAKLFARKWQLHREDIAHPDFMQIASSELASAQIYIPFPQHKDVGSAELVLAERAVFLLPLEDENSWPRASRLVRKYQKTFGVADPVSLAIGCTAGIDLATAARRVERIVRDLNIDVEQSADVIIADADDRERWLARLPQGPRLLLIEDQQLQHYPRVKDLSPSGLRHSLHSAVKGNS